MRDRVIKAMVESVGQDRAEKFYALFVERCCGGIEPKDGDTFTREDIADAFKDNIPARNALIKALCGEQKEAPKSTALKEKHRDTIDTAILLAEYLKGGAPAWIKGELLDRVTQGGSSLPAPCLFLRDDGTVYVTESVKWIEWIRAGMPLADGMKIDGKFRKPVRIGDEKPAQTLPIDPFPVGMRGDAPLTMPDFMSRCGASLGVKNDKGETVCVAADVLSFLRLIGKYEDPSQREQRDACETAKTGGLDALKKTWPKASNAWDVGERPEATVPAVPFVEPTAVELAPRGGMTAPSGFAPTLHFVGVEHARPAWERLKKLVGPSPRVRLTCDAEMPAGGFVSEVRAQRLAAADAVMALLNADSIAAGSHVVNFSGPTVPVVVGVCFSEYAFPGAVTLPRDGNTPTNDREWAALAKDILDFAATLRPRAKAATSPAWLSAAPFPLHDPDARAFHGACVTAYPDLPIVQTLCRTVGLDMGCVRASGSLGPIWMSVLDAAANQGKTGALFTQILGDSSVSAHFNRWR